MFTDAPAQRVDVAPLMLSFAERTGITGARPQTRYLWTDAFAVCNFLGLAVATGESRYEELALRLVDCVHQTLGQHRGDDGREGWLDGASGAHPTRGGLRIGKKLPERRVGQPLEEQLEWDRDGQYFHYLTKWMHALDQVTRVTGQTRFEDWARELARTACGAFTVRRRDGRAGLVWKMSIDLSRPLVPSMGQHDAVDGLVTCTELGLEREAAALGAMNEQLGDLATNDPLGIGGLLFDACRVAQLGGDDHLKESLLDAALRGLRDYARQGEHEQPASMRLAFRELGLCRNVGPRLDERQRSTGFRASRVASTGDRILLARARSPRSAHMVGTPRHQRGHVGDDALAGRISSHRASQDTFGTNACAGELTAVTTSTVTFNGTVTSCGAGSTLVETVHTTVSVHRPVR